MPDRVVQEAQKHLTQESFVSATLNFSGGCDMHVDLSSAPKDLGGAGALLDELIEVQLANLKRSAVGIGQRQG